MVPSILLVWEALVETNELKLSKTINFIFLYNKKHGGHGENQIDGDFLCTCSCVSVNRTIYPKQQTNKAEEVSLVIR